MTFEGASDGAGWRELSDLMETVLPDVLLEPFADGPPCGTNQRVDVGPRSPYYRLRDSRAEARAIERRTVDEETSESARDLWRAIELLATEVLAEHSKDLEVASWLAESWVRRNGLDGLAAGAALLSGLLDRFWEHGLFPAADEDGDEGRLAAVAGLSGQGSDGTLLQPLRRITLFERPDGTPIQFWQFEQSEQVELITDERKREQRQQAGILPFPELERDAATTAVRHGFGVLLEQAERATAAWKELEETLDRIAGTAAPAIRRVGELVARMGTVFRRYAPPPPAPMQMPVPDGTAEGDDTEGANGAAGRVSFRAAADREIMLGELRRIADYFRAAEPASPLAEMLDEAVRRANLSWSDLLTELVPDRGVLDQILASIGLRPRMDG